MKSLLLAVLALAAASASDNGGVHIRPVFHNEFPDGFIVGGEEAVPHSYPFMAAFTLEGLCCCGGSILDERTILTAAHCVDGYEYFEVILGAHNVFEDEPEQVRFVVTSGDVTIHERWNPFTVNNDVALIRLPEPITFNGIVKNSALWSR